MYKIDEVGLRFGVDLFLFCLYRSPNTFRVKIIIGSRFFYADFDYGYSHRKRDSKGYEATENVGCGTRHTLTSAPTIYI